MLLCCPGCSSEGSSTMLLGTGERALGTGDWDDVDNAVNVAASQNEMAVVDSREIGTDEKSFDLVTVTDEPARVTASRRGGAGGVIEVRAQVGRFGDAEREKKLIAAIRQRLGNLEGVDFAPVR